MSLVDVARSHLGDDAPLNTCVRLGMRAWSLEYGLPVLETDSVSTAERLARAGTHGWTYHQGTAGIRVGDFGDWDPGALGNPDARHVSIVELVDGLRWRGIGAGTPSGKVALQPQSGGTNPLSVLRGYFRPPAKAPVVQAPPKAPVKPAPKPEHHDERVHVVERHDTVWGLAKRYKVSRQALLKANPPLPSRRSADYHIATPSLIVIGQRLRIPSS